MTGAMCGHYRLGAQLGAGGMGRVYIARDMSGAKTVAIKICERRVVSDETARALELVQHPNVVRVLDHGLTHDGASYVVMELVRGSPLGRQMRKRGALAYSRVLHLGTQLLAGLDALHRLRLVHGDIKSDNLMVDVSDDDRAILIDLGFSAHLTEEHMFMGTPEYVAPEVICGAPLHASSDLYGVGIVLYEMVTGTTPFAGGSADEIFERHIIEPPPPMSVMCADRAIPVELEALVGRALAKDPAARPASALEFAHELRHSLPPSHEDLPPRSTRFSTSGPTADWARPTFSDTASSHVR